MNGIFLILATFLASAIESVEMVAIVVGVGEVRGWRATWFGSVVGVAVLAVTIVVMGSALRDIPIEWLRLGVGALLLIFGLQWLKKAVVRLSQPSDKEEEEESAVDDEAHPKPESGMDWYAFVLAFKGVVLEGLEIAFIVVTFGAEANQIGLASLGAAAAFLLTWAIGLMLRGWLSNIPREWLRFGVGILLTTFGTYWAAEGAQVSWPGHDMALLVLLAAVTAVAAGLLGLYHQSSDSRHIPQEN